MAKKSAPKKKDKARKKYSKPSLKKHGSISGLSEQVVGAMFAG